jgi:hypothetical protein
VRINKYVMYATSYPPWGLLLMPFGIAAQVTGVVVQVLVFWLWYRSVTAKPKCSTCNDKGHTGDASAQPLSDAYGYCDNCERGAMLLRRHVRNVRRFQKY